MAALSAAALLGFASTALAHGTVQGIVAGGQFYQGYNPSMQYQNPPPTVIGWSIPEDQSNGFVPPNNYTSPDIVCHLGATPAGGHAVVAAGDVVELQWTAWPSSHHGPVLDYLANCNGPCESVDKTTLEFFKIDQTGLVTENSQGGTWGTDQLIANNNSWAVTIPKDLTPGNYVLRHEIIALHSAGQANGAQNYPQCINLQVTGGGNAAPAGTLGTALYQPNNPGIQINIYTQLASYPMPGPTLAPDAVPMAQTAVAISGNGVVQTAGAAPPAAAPAKSAAAPTSAPASSAAAPSSQRASSAAGSPATKAAAGAASTTFVTVTVTSQVGAASACRDAPASSQPAGGEIDNNKEGHDSRKSGAQGGMGAARGTHHRHRPDRPFPTGFHGRRPYGDDSLM